MVDFEIVAGDVGGASCDGFGDSARGEGEAEAVAIGSVGGVHDVVM